MRNEMFTMVVLAMLGVLSHGATLLLTGGNPGLATFAAVVVSAFAFVSVAAFVSLAGAVFAVVGAVFAVVVSASAITTVVATTVVATTVVAFAVDTHVEYGVPLRYGLAGYGVSVASLGVGLYLVGYHFQTAGYAAFGWYLLPVVGGGVATLVLRAGKESMVRAL